MNIVLSSEKKCWFLMLWIFERKIWMVIHNNLTKFFDAVLEVTYLRNGMFQNVNEVYIINDVVKHPFFTIIIDPSNSCFKPF